MAVAKTHEVKPNRASSFRVFACFTSADILLTKAKQKVNSKLGMGIHLASSGTLFIYVAKGMNTGKDE